VGLRQHSVLVETSSHPDSLATDLLLVNLAAGGGRGGKVLPALREFAQKRGWKVEICVTRNREELAAQARTAAEAGRKRILALGGDGTFQVLLNALVHYPETILGVIPAGGGNDVAAALGLPQDPVQAAAMILEGETCYLDAVRVQTSEGNERLYTGGGGVGLDAEAARYASGGYRNLPGRARYLLAVIRALFGFHSIRVRICLQAGEPGKLETTALLVGVLNTPTYGAGVCLAPEARTDDGMLNLVVVEELSVGRILTLLPALMMSGELKTKRVRRFSASRARIETDAPCWFHGDGELLGTTPVEISVVPKAVRVIRAARKGTR